MHKIAFIGLGHMGGGMAPNLAKAGHEVRAVDLSEDALAHAAERGCKSAKSTDEAVKGADAVVTLGAPRETSMHADDARPWPVGRAGAPLVVALAHHDSASEHVRVLGHDADVVLPANTHGRVVLATALALLRWRAR
jgi:pyrroline-5-carboxylate reductase